MWQIFFIVRIYGLQGLLCIMCIKFLPMLDKVRKGYRKCYRDGLFCECVEKAVMAIDSGVE